MGKTVIFLGAGASKALGLPLTNEILPALLERLVLEPPEGEPLFGGDPDDQQLLKRCLGAILPGLGGIPAGPKEKRDAWRDGLPLITDVLSAVDYLLLSENAPDPDFSRQELARARVLLERALFELLVRNESPDALPMEGIPGDVRSEWQETAGRRLVPPRPATYAQDLRRTVDWIEELSSKPGDRVTLISTNYDIEVEQGLYNRLGYGLFGRVDFGLTVREPVGGQVYRRPDDARLGVFKLHGSLNWLRCDLCDNVYVNPVGAIAYLSFLLGDDAERYKERQPWLEQLEADNANRCHCGYRPLRHVIVAPSFVRDVRDPMLREVWRSALEALRQADEWVIVGYSLPPEDVAIRSMFLRAYRGRDGAAPRVVVVQKGEKERTRYQLLFPGHAYVAGGLSGYLDSRQRGPA
jgi:NAD-dependent SIR2 family protein deacetylase